MVAKCANPDCNRTVPRLIDYCYWLCPDCAATYTLEREADHPGIQVLPKQLFRCQATASR
jgi:hypothetical protein